MSKERADVIQSDSKFDFEVVTGTVAEMQDRNETQMRGIGRGTSVGGQIYDVKIDSYVNNFQKIFLIKPDGKEIELNTTNWEVGCRSGHTLSIVYGKVRGTGGRKAIYVYNHNTEKLKEDTNNIIRILGGWFWRSTLLLIFLLVFQYTIFEHYSENIVNYARHVENYIWDTIDSFGYAFYIMAEDWVEPLWLTLSILITALYAAYRMRQSSLYRFRNRKSVRTYIERLKKTPPY